MNTNIPALATVYADLEAVLAKLQAISAEQIESANLVPMVKAVQSIGAYSAAIDAQIQARAIGNGELIPGVVVKDAITHTHTAGGTTRMRPNNSRKSSLATRRLTAN